MAFFSIALGGEQVVIQQCQVSAENIQWYRYICRRSSLPIEFLCGLLEMLKFFVELTDRFLLGSVEICFNCGEVLYFLVVDQKLYLIRALGELIDGKSKRQTNQFTLFHIGNCRNDMVAFFSSRIGEFYGKSNIPVCMRKQNGSCQVFGRLLLRNSCPENGGPGVK